MPPMFIGAVSDVDTGRQPELAPPSFRRGWCHYWQELREKAEGER